MIKVTFTDEIEIITSTEHLYQWDVGQVLEIDGLNIGTPMIHFGVKGDATGYAVQSQIVDGKLRCGIPDTTLQSGKQIIAYIYVSAGASKYTERVILIPVVERNKPSNYKTVNMDEVTETQSYFDSMVDRVEALESGVKRINQRVPISFWAGTEAEYNNLTKKENNCLYITTDSEDNEKLKMLIEEYEEIKGLIDKHNKVLWEGDSKTLPITDGIVKIPIVGIGDYNVIKVTTYINGGSEEEQVYIRNDSTFENNRFVFNKLDNYGVFFYYKLFNTTSDGNNLVVYNPEYSGTLCSYSDKYDGNGSTHEYALYVTKVIGIC